MATNTVFNIVGGRPTADKSPTDTEYYGISLADDLAGLPGVTVASYSLVLVGVTLAPGEVVFLQGTDLVALLTGGDTADGATNKATFHFTFSNKESHYQTLYFRMVPA